MSALLGTNTFIFHTDIGPVITQVQTVSGYDVEDVIRNRAISQARRIQFVTLGQTANPNDQTAARTVASVYTSVTEELT